MGARAGYSVLNGVVVTVLCLAGVVSLVQNVVPLEATLGILLWIGIIMTAQAFQETPKRHTLAVAVGLVPAIGAWTYLVMDITTLKASKTLYTLRDSFADHAADIYLHGVIALNQGFIITSTIFAAILSCVIDRQFSRAATWTVTAAILSMTGVIHGYELTPAGVQNKFGLWAAPQFAAAYWVAAALLVTVHLAGRAQYRPPDRRTN